MMDVSRERTHQEALKNEGRFEHTCADEMDPFRKLAILGEEFGEVSRALLEKHGESNDRWNKDLRKELIQVAAVAVAWAESLTNFNTIRV